MPSFEIQTYALFELLDFSGHVVIKRPPKTLPLNLLGK